MVLLFVIYSIQSTISTVILDIPTFLKKMLISMPFIADWPQKQTTLVNDACLNKYQSNNKCNYYIK